MTVNELIELLENIRKDGHGDDEIQAWDPALEQYTGVTYLTFSGGGGLLKFTLMIYDACK